MNIECSWFTPHEDSVIVSYACSLSFPTRAGWCGVTRCIQLLLLLTLCFIAKLKALYDYNYYIDKCSCIQWPPY